MSNLATEHQIGLFYRYLLGRDPDDHAIASFANKHSEAHVLSNVLGSLEYRIKNQRDIGSNYYQYNSLIDAVGIVLSHEDKDRKSIKDRLVNYLGVIIDPVYLPSILNGRQGQVEDVPIPANWHADLAEFAAALRAVDLAKNSFRMVELGCGWGCWLLNTGVAARRRGLQVDLIGAEGDAGHVAFAQRGCIENGFTDDNSKIYRRIVGPRPGLALFPKQETSGEKWGLEAVFNPTDEQVKHAHDGNEYDIVPVITFDDLSPNGDAIDLLHMDIQGVEAEFIESCIQAMNRLVAYLVVGTHSRVIEGKIFSIMLSHGWILEIERPALVNLSTGIPVTTVDGIQGWRNPKLR